MKINKKLVALMMTLVIGGSIFTGCGKKAEPETPVVETPAVEEETPAAEEEVIEEGTIEEVEGETDPTASQELFFTLTDGIEHGTLINMPTEMFADSYGIDSSILESYSVNMPMMNVHADEFGIFELKDAKDADAVMAGIEKRQQALVTQWQTYLPDQLELVKNYKTAVKGNMVLFVISSDAEQIVEKFNEVVAE